MIETEFIVNTSDYRQASYYALTVRYRTSFRIFGVVVLIAIIYAIIGVIFDLGTLNPLIFLIAAAYLVWMIIIFAGAQRNILKYIQSPDSLIGCTYRLSIDPRRLSIDIPEKNVHVNMKISKLACVIEIYSLFMLYVNGQQLYLLPKRCLTPDECEEVRKIFHLECGKNFTSRFFRKRS